MIFITSTTELLIAGKELLKLYEKYMTEAVQQLSLTQTEIEIIMFLFNNPGYDTAKDISELRKFPKSCISKAVETLVRLEYIKTSPDGYDRRILHLKLTEKSAKVIELTQKIRHRFLETIYQGIEEEEKQKLLQILNKISVNVKEAL